MSVRQGVADAAAAVTGIAGARFQKLQVHIRHIQHADFLVLEHVGVESHAGFLVEDKLFQALASGGEVHHLVNLALQRRLSHDLSRIGNHSKPEYFHFPGLHVYRDLACGNIHGIQSPALLGPDSLRRSA